MSSVDAISKNIIPGTIWPWGWIKFDPDNFNYGCFGIVKTYKYSDIVSITTGYNQYVHIKTNDGRTLGIAGPKTRDILLDFESHSINIPNRDKIIKNSNTILVIIIILALIFLIFVFFKLLISP